eukprot:GHVR01076928.1.p1 GENE.GHVR01076928.1~~GHVR01076928.1.p1  ORF type:complete len:765 (+),score=215.51 GHVR01076928.1:809-3103(+)
MVVYLNLQMAKKKKKTIAGKKKKTIQTHAETTEDKNEEEDENIHPPQDDRVVEGEGEGDGGEGEGGDTSEDGDDDDWEKLFEKEINEKEMNEKENIKTDVDKCVDKCVKDKVKDTVERGMDGNKNINKEGTESHTHTQIPPHIQTRKQNENINKSSHPTSSAPPKLTKEELREARLRSPICCILGHVDTGKTKLLDIIRHTNVQGGEAGGITQQIGATFFPQSALKEQSEKVNRELEYRVPGLLIIDTPGHESFNNLRQRGSSLCDIAILVVDIMHGLEPQTLESIQLLRNRQCPFLIALNKIDRLYSWKSEPFRPMTHAIQKQNNDVKNEFEKRYTEIQVSLREQGLNVELYWDNLDFRKYISVVPTSAMTGEGVPDILMLLVRLTQEIMTQALVWRSSLQCTILEVKQIEGLGTTIDVVLVQGTLHEGDTIVVCGMDGAIVTTARALLTPQPLKELRVKGEYVHHKEIHAAMGIKISANGLEDAVAGTSLIVAPSADCDMIETYKDEVMMDLSDIFKSVDKSGVGVYVVASTLGSLEALLTFLKSSEIPVFCVNIGTVSQKDVKKAQVMREKGSPEYAVILAFDVKIDPEAKKEAEKNGVKIMMADIIYHLFDQFTLYMTNMKAEKKKEKSSLVVFPSVIRIMPQHVFNKNNPIVAGVIVEEGVLKIGTPLVAADKDNLYVGSIASIELNHKNVEFAKKGSEVAVKIIGGSATYGRHFDSSSKLYSRITRDNIDVLKTHFRDEMTNSDWKLVVQLKKIFMIA